MSLATRSNIQTTITFEWNLMVNNVNLHRVNVKVGKV
jgi:hypothetical protein